MTIGNNADIFCSIFKITFNFLLCISACINFLLCILACVCIVYVPLMPVPEEA